MLGAGRSIEVDAGGKATVVKVVRTGSLEKKEKRMTDGN